MNSKMQEIISSVCAGDDRPGTDDIARDCYTSVMQLHRDFYNLTGYSAGEYMRRLRLSDALCRIKASDSPLADIAYSCGYSSQQALCREIKSLLGMTATEYRKGSEYYFLSAPGDGRFLTMVSRVSVPPALCLRFYSSAMRGIENRAVGLFFRNNPDYSGRLFGRDGKQRGSMLCYELYAEKCGGLNTDGFEMCGETAGYVASCAQVRVKNNVGEISDAWDYLYSEWLSKSMFEYAGRDNDRYENQYFEEYIYKKCVPVRLKLCLPLVKKPGFLRVSVIKEASMLFVVSDKKGLNAERRASRAVVDYLMQNYPFVVRTADEFFYSCSGSTCTCGFRLRTGIGECGGLRKISFENQSFAVLFFDGISNYAQACEILTNWLCENGMEQDGEPFAVYDTSESYENPSMRLYCPVKNVRI